MTQDATEQANDMPSTDCLLRHGLEQQPFDAVAGDTFLYTDPALDMVVGVLLEHLRNDDSLLLLKGDDGAGKSTQLLRLLSRGAETLEFCAFKARPGTGFAAVDYTIRKYWERLTGGDDALPLEELLCKIAADGRRPVIVIDDAHHLDRTTLADLARLRREARRQCNVMPGLLLVGEPAMEIRLEQGTDDDSPAEPRISVQLRPLTREQTEAYLRHRLQAAGADNPDLLGGEIALAIHQESGGLPAGINAAANRHLQSVAGEGGAGAPQPQSPRAGGAVWTHRWFVPAVGIILAVGVLAAALSVFRSSDEPLETRELLALPEPRALSQADAPEPSSAQPGDTPTPRFTTVTPDTPDAPDREEPRQAAASDPQADAAAAAGSAPDPEPVPHSEPAPAPAPEAEPAAEPEPGPETEPRPEPEEAPMEQTEAEPPPEAATPAPTAPASSSPAAGLQDAAWLREQPAAHYTIQILGLSDLQALRRFGQEQRLDMELAWFRTVRNDQDWFVLVAGRFPDADSARAAIEGLPENLRRNQPWIRSFGSVRDAMAQAR